MKLSRRTWVRSLIGGAAACAAIAVSLVSYNANAASLYTDLEFEVRSVTGSRGNAKVRVGYTNRGSEVLPANASFKMSIDIPFDARLTTPGNFQCQPAVGPIGRRPCLIDITERNLQPGRGRFFEVSVFGTWPAGDFIQVAMPIGVGFFDTNALNNIDRQPLP